jgi:hypothetical protein
VLVLVHPIDMTIGCFYVALVDAWRYVGSNGSVLVLAEKFFNIRPTFCKHCEKQDSFPLEPEPAGEGELKRRDLTYIKHGNYFTVYTYIVQVYNYK